MSEASAQRVLKTALKRLVQDAGGLEAAASVTRVGVSQLSEYGNINSAKQVPVDVVLDLEAICGRPLVTTALARAAGYELIPVSISPNASALALVIAELAKDVGQTFADAALALGHEDLSEDERARLLADFEELRRVSAAAMNLLRPALKVVAC